MYICIDKVQKKLADALFLNAYVIPAYSCVGELFGLFKSFMHTATSFVRIKTNIFNTIDEFKFIDSLY